MATQTLSNRWRRFRQDLADVTGSLVETVLARTEPTVRFGTHPLAGAVAPIVAAPGGATPGLSRPAPDQLVPPPPGPAVGEPTPTVEEEWLGNSPECVIDPIGLTGHRCSNRDGRWRPGSTCYASAVAQVRRSAFARRHQQLATLESPAPRCPDCVDGDHCSCSTPLSITTDSFGVNDIDRCCCGNTL